MLLLLGLGCFIAGMLCKDLVLGAYHKVFSHAAVEVAKVEDKIDVVEDKVVADKAPEVPPAA